MEETDSKVRRTRSAKVKSTPPPKVIKAAKSSPKTDGKPGPRRTRKKVVLMEVEVSDDEDDATVENSGDEKSELNETDEDKLLASPEASNDASEHKLEETEKGDLNGDNDVSEEKSTLDDSITVVFNDIEMLQTEESEEIDKTEESTQKTQTNEESVKENRKEPEAEVEAVKSPEKKEPTSEVKASPKKVKVSKEKPDDAEKKEPVAKPVAEKPKEVLNDIEMPQTEEGEKVSKTEKSTPKTETSEEPVKADKKEPVKENKKEDKKEAAKEDKKQTEAAVEAVKSPAKKEKTPDVKDSPKKVKVSKEKTNDSEKQESVAKPVAEKPKEDSEPEKTEEKKPATLVIEIEKTKETEKKIEVVKEKEESIKMDVDEANDVEEQTNEKARPKKKAVETKQKEAEVEKMEVDGNVQESAVDSSKADSKEKKTEDVKDGKNKEADAKGKEKTNEDSKVKEKTNEDAKEKSTDSSLQEKKADEGEEGDSKNQKQNGDPDAENISEDELPGVPVVKVPEAEEVSDEELPGPKRAELPADTEVVSEDELPTVKSEGKKEGVKRKLNETDDYDPGSPTSESEAPAKKPTLEKDTAEKEEKPKPKKLPELDKYWKAVNDDPTDFTGWTYLLQYVDQENDMEAAREAYDAFLSHYPYCYGYWRKYADYEKRKGNKKKCEEVFERGLKAIPLSVDLWIHYLTYVKSTRAEEEEFIRSQFDRALAACGLEFRSDRLWDSYIKWETEGKRLQKVTAIYDKLLATPTQGYTTHFDNFQEHVASNPPNKVIDVDEFLALRKEVRNVLKHDTPPETTDSDAPPGDEDQSKVISSDEETKSIRERIVSIRRKIHKGTVNAVTARWNYEEGIKRPYFHVKPLERCQLKNWHDYLDYETEQGDRVRIIVLFERCLIACALYEEFWMKFVHFLENLKDPELQSKIRDVYERACTIHHLKKPNLHLQWAMFEENIGNLARAAEILVNLEKTVPNVLQIAYRRINLERRRSDHEKCTQLYEHYISNSKNKMISSNIAIKFSRFCFRILKDVAKAQEVLKTAINKDPNNPRLYLQLIDLTLQKDDVTEKEVIEIIDSFLEKESTDIDQKTLFAQRKLEYLEDFGGEIQSVQQAYENYQKLLKLNKENNKKKEVKSEASTAVAKKEKPTTQSSSQASSYGNYGQYGGNPAQPPYAYSGQQGQYNYSQYGQGEQYQYQNWQYPQGGYSGYNQWGGYSGGYGY